MARHGRTTTLLPTVILLTAVTVGCTGDSETGRHEVPEEHPPPVGSDGAGQDTLAVHQGTGTVLGTLVDSQGQPRSHIRVTALEYVGVDEVGDNIVFFRADNDTLRVKLHFRDGRLPEVQTDDRGHFRIPNLPSGRWILVTSLGPGSTTDYIRVQSARTESVLIIELKSGRTVDVGTVRIRI